MENEMFTFLVLTQEGHDTRYCYCSRKEADATFDRLIVEQERKPATALGIAYYCASVGGCVNAWHA